MDIMNRSRGHVKEVDMNFQMQNYVEFVNRYQGYPEFAYVQVKRHEYEFYERTPWIPKHFGKGYLIMAIRSPGSLSIALGKLKMTGMIDLDGYAMVLNTVIEYTLDEYEVWGEKVVETVGQVYEYKDVENEENYYLDSLLDQCGPLSRKRIEDIEMICHLIDKKKRWDAIGSLIELGISSCPECYEYVISFVRYLQSNGVELSQRNKHVLSKAFYRVRNIVKRGNVCVRHPLSD